MSELKEGHIYHAIYYGLNAMGPHNSLVNEEERWLITAYVQELQKETTKDKLAVMYTVAKNTKTISFALMVLDYCFDIWFYHRRTSCMAKFND